MFKQRQIVFTFKAHGLTALHTAVGEGRLSAVGLLMDHVTHVDLTPIDKVRECKYTYIRF